MNYFYRRHLWLVSLCVVAIWAIWAAHLVSAQSAQTVDLTASPTSLPTTPGGEVTVTITYTTTQPAQLFYYPPFDFEFVSKDGAADDPDYESPSGLNGLERLKWDVTEPGTKEIRLRVKDNAVSGEKSHGVDLNTLVVETIVLTLSEPVAEAIPVQSAIPDLQLISAEGPPETVEPGQSFTITVTYKNSGKEPADDVKVNLTSESTVFLGLQLLPVGMVEAGQTITKSHSISTTADTADGVYSLTVKLLNGESEYDNQPVTITVEQPLQETPLPPSTSAPVESPQSTSVTPTIALTIQVSEETTSTIDVSAAPIAQETPETGEATPIPEANGEGGGNKTIQWILGGVIVAAVLLLVALSIYSLLYARRQAESAKMIPISGTKGQPYLKSSNGRSFPITSFPFTIGRGEGNSLIIDESFPQWESMSRNHAQIVQHQQGYVIEDMGSQNKLRVQRRLTERNLLRNGWQILIGGVEFTFFDGSNTPGGSV